MVIKQLVYNKRFDLTAKVYVADVEWSDDRHGSDSDGHIEQVKFYITIQQLAQFLNDSFSTWEVSYQLVYLQAIYDSWNLDCYDSLFQDEDFVEFMYQEYGHKQSY